MRKDVTNMAERKYQFERLTPIDNMDLDVYGEAIDYVFDNSDIKNVAISALTVRVKAASWLHTRKNTVICAFCIFLSHISNLPAKKMRRK